MMGALYSASRRRVPVVAPANPIPVGPSSTTATLNSVSFDIFTDRGNCTNPGLLCSFHGSGRDADGHRDSFENWVDLKCLILCVPLFDDVRFTSDEYQRCNVVDSDENVNPFSEWSTKYAHSLVAWARAREARPTMPFRLSGHSAGAQHLSRVAAYHPLPGITRYIIANPSTHVRAKMTEPMPYGFSNFPSSVMTPLTALQNYLAAPITLYAGTADTGTEDLAVGPQSMEQGENRIERARFVFAEAQQEAQTRGWEFNWRKVEAQGVGHSNRDMYNAPEVDAAWAA
jgi:pimeloyl-ACP methyl ester carboxylesterase